MITYNNLDSEQFSNSIDQVAAIVLAAGVSRRMGRPKMLLPWGNTTVIQQVINVLRLSGLRNILAVTGGLSHEIQKMLSGTEVVLLQNPDYDRTEMLTSFQLGLRYLLGEGYLAGESLRAVLVVLGDQPQIEIRIVRSILETYLHTGAELVVPSYQMRRGHPWLAGRPFWPAILSLSPDQTLREFLHAYHAHIHYLVVDCPSILKDLDTPEDWENEKPF
jgi:molybdenum cofactor cytidylyltransferase